MAHLLLLEVPGGNDFTILEEAVRCGHQVTFFTGDIDFYKKQQDLPDSSLRLAQEIVVVQPFSYASLEQKALHMHRQTAFDAVLCLIDIRMIEASRLAEKLSLRFLNASTAKIMRDKYSVRQILERHGIQQPAFALATSNDELRRAIDAVGFPVLIKPSDGYGSQNISVFFTPENLRRDADPLADYLPCRHDYGLGVRSNNRLLVEQYIEGQVIGCDTFTRDGEHIFLGINEKQFFAPPSFAISGSCFPSYKYDTAAIRHYVISVLDALRFDCGAAHTEILVTKRGPYLIEVNPRLVGAQISRLLGYALDRSIHVDLIDLHLGRSLNDLREAKSCCCAVSRWIVTGRHGVLRSIDLPDVTDPLIRRVALSKKPGDQVRPPHDNGDRLGCVMAVGASQEEAESTAEEYLNHVRIDIQEL